jgi:hypothetical protein
MMQTGNLIVDLSATDNAVLDAMVVDLAAMEVDLAAIEVLLTAANVDHAANEALLITIDSDTDAIKTAVQLIDNAISGTEMQVDVVAALPAGSNTIGVVDLGSTDNAVLDAIDAVLDTIKTDTGTIDSDTNDTKNALNKMLYGTGLVITALDGGGGDQTLGATYESLYVGVGGNVKVTLATSASDFTFVNVASGQMLPIQITHVKQSGTTATNMIAMKA